jgi:5'(3')-deoxyribonucleotidase
MDGVLSDFVGAVLDLHSMLGYDIVDTVDVTSSLEESLEITVEEMWRNIGNVKYFWRDLKLTRYAHDIYWRACAVVGTDSVFISTSPSECPACASDKFEWCKRHLDVPHRNIMVGSSKHLMANPNHLLIDDTERNIERFEAEGGKGLLYPAPWNRRRNEYQTYTIADIEADLVSAIDEGTANVPKVSRT